MVHLQPGDTIGPYRIEALVGEGGMGAVYRATDTRLHRTVAIKLVAPGLSANPESRARFEREGRLLASLNHPNVAAIHGMEEFQGVRALVLEFVEGHTLADVIARAHPSAGSESPRSRPADHEGGVAAGRDGTPRALRMDDALRIARQIALALTAAHDKGIVHRDSKPANIKITPTGDVKYLISASRNLRHHTTNSPLRQPPRGLPSLRVRAPSWGPRRT